MYAKKTKIRLRRKTITSELMKTSLRKLDKTIQRPVSMLCKSFKFVSFNILVKYAVKKRFGWAEFKDKNKTFFFHNIFS